MIELKDIIEINKQFDKGDIINKSSIEFAISYFKDSKDWIKQLSYITRALLIDDCCIILSIHKGIIRSISILESLEECDFGG